MDSAWIAQIDRYMQRYRWKLLDQAEFVRLVDEQTDHITSVKNIHAAILCVYSKVLYWSCSGAAGRLHQEQAYSELAFFLDQIAARRYSNVRADATQGALERIYRCFAHCRQPEAFLAFALQKLRDAARVEIRSLHRAEANLSVDTEFADGGSQLACQDLDPLNAALQKDAQRQLVICAERFVQEHPRAENQLIVLWLRYIEGLDYQTIAKQLDKTTAAVQVLCSRGMAHLHRDIHLRALAAELGYIGA